MFRRCVCGAGARAVSVAFAGYITPEPSAVFGLQQGFTAFVDNLFAFTNGVFDRCIAGGMVVGAYEF